MAAIKPTVLHHVNFRAPEALIRRLRDFYVDVVGLREGPLPHEFGAVAYWLYLGETPVLHLNGAPMDHPGQDASPRPTGWVDHIAFSCDDYAGARAHLDSLAIRYATNEIASIGLQQIFLTDPAGLRVELNFFSH
jgi:catechol 2,3-dioxygenase-like lactoylglutathione lyase family enzyme